MNTPVTIGSERLQLGEGARWVDGRLVCVDILAGRLLQLSSGHANPLPAAGVPERTLVGDRVEPLTFPLSACWEQPVLAVCAKSSLARQRLFRLGCRAWMCGARLAQLR